MKSTSASSSSKHNLAFDESELAEARSGKPPAKRTRQSQSTDDRRSISSVVWVAEECVLVDVAGLLCKQYKTLLQTHSKCFERVFRGEKDRNVVDTEMKAQGLKVYGVSGVSASDFEKLMLVLGVGAFVWANNETPFELDFAVLRAAVALQFQSVQANVTVLLEKLWDPTLDAHRIQTHMRSRVANTIAISRQFALPQLRKRAFYLLLAEPDFDNLDYTNELKAQFTAAASAADANDHAWALLYEVSAVQPTKSLLSADDYDLLVKARRRLTEAWLTICTTFPAIAEPNPHSGPCSPQSVKDVFWTRHMIGSGIYQKYLYDPLNGIYDVSHDTEALWNSLAGWDICEMCHLRMNTFLRRRREELWTEMDTWLGL